MTVTRISLWSGPRNVSTALMYSFAQRSDTIVFDEPLYAHYLRVTGADHPGKAEIINSMESDGTKVINDIIFGYYNKPVLFFKQMVHHLVDIDESFILKTTNVFLIRNPDEILASYSKIIPNPDMKDIGIKKQFELFHKLEAAGKVTCVIDSSELLKNPAVVLNELCRKTGIEFQKSMLNWKPGPLKEDGIWAKYWYNQVHQSSGFRTYKPKQVTVPGNLLRLAEQCKPYYEFLKSKSLKAER
ncbi:MAG: branched chain amino acid aminotransferase [Ignavibacteriaceae bacterium]